MAAAKYFRITTEVEVTTQNIRYYSLTKKISDDTQAVPHSFQHNVKLSIVSLKN
jgi:hypothetical protein